jgi:hypothetical protein
MSTEADREVLPVLKRYPIIAGALAGLVFRAVYSGDPNSLFTPMLGAFVFGAPIVVGMLTVYLAERVKRRTWSYYFVAAAVANMLFVAGTFIAFLEGAICAIVILPMFAITGGVAGLAMGLLCRTTNWPGRMMQCAAALPIALAFLRPLIPTPDAIGMIERRIHIGAAPDIVWQQINRLDDIRDDETRDVLARRIGVPMPVSGETRATAEGFVRMSRWGKQVHFEEVIQEWEPGRYVRWTYRFQPDSFPRRALDDHVVIGGHYFDLIDTSYALATRDDGQSTELTTVIHYRISTQFNFYAHWVAQVLIGNLNENGLRIYKARSESAMMRRTQESPT